MDSRLKGISIESKNAQNGLRTGKLWSSEDGTAKLIPTELDQKSPVKGGQLGLMQLIPAELMQESSALPKEVSSCRRAQPQLMQESLATAHAGELSHSSCRRAQHCSKRSAHLCARGQLMQESSTLTKEVNLALRKRSAHVGELNSDQKWSVRPDELDHNSSS